LKKEGYYVPSLVPLIIAPAIHFITIRCNK